MNSRKRKKCAPGLRPSEVSARLASLALASGPLPSMQALGSALTARLRLRLRPAPERLHGLQRPKGTK